MRARAHQLLRQALGPTAEFRAGQLEAILAIAEARERVLVVQQTGWGKSTVYFVATRLLREQGLGPTLLVSPLLALMRDQLLAAAQYGVTARTMNSSNQEEWDEVRAEIAADRCDLLLLSPEHLTSGPFVEKVLPSMPKGAGLFVVDEAHCVSDWGHDFRPDYRKIVRIVQGLPPRTPVLATTATANERVATDVEEQLGPGMRTLRGPLTRGSLRLQAIRLEDQAERLAWLAENLPRLAGSGIIYCLTKADSERVSAWLASCGIDAPIYHSKIENEQRRLLEERLRRNEVKALVATIALGMGFDKPDLGFVIHFQRPGSVVSYYQQIGRAGRAIEDAVAVLLTGREDQAIQDYFISNAFPGVAEMEEVVAAVEGAEHGLTLGELAGSVNLSDNQIERCLKVLEIDGALVRDRMGRKVRIIRTANEWRPEGNRPESVTALRRAEDACMVEFVDSPTCLMEFVARELDDPEARPCGRCAVCAGPFLPTSVDPALVRGALAFLRGRRVEVAPRRRWPNGTPAPWSGAVRQEEQVEVGRALAIYGDPGWGRLVSDGIAAGEFPDELVRAAADLIRGEWAPAPFPVWVTFVPSLRDERLVPGLASRLADLLGLPCRTAVRKVRQTQQQKLMRNSEQQLMNIADAFEVDPGQLLPGPVLLVDDVINSRWTIAVSGALLRRAGAGPVLPFALAKVAGG